MKKLTPILLVSFSAYAQDPTFVRVLEHLNRDGVLPQVERSCNDRTETQTLAQECALKLCGAPTEAKTAYITDHNIPDITKPEILSQVQALDPEIEKAVELQIKNGKTVLEAMKKQMAQGPLKLEASALTDEEYNSLADDTYGNFLVPNIDLSKPLQDRLKFDVLLSNGSTREEVNGANEYATAKAKGIVSLFPEACQYEVLTLDEAKAEFKNKLKLFTDKLTLAREKNPDILKDENEKILEISKKIDEGDYSALTDIATDYYSLAVYEFQAAMAIGATPDLLTNNEGKYCVSESCKKGVLNTVNKVNWESMAGKLEKKLQDGSTPEQLKAFCRSNAAQIALKDSEVEAYKAQLPRIRKGYNDRVLSRFSAHSEKAFNDYLDNELNFAFGKDGSSSVDDFKQRLGYATEITPDLLEDKKALMLKLSRLKSASFNNEIPVGSDLDCSQSLGATAWDAFSPEPQGGGVSDEDPTKHNIYISFFSCSHPSMGEQVLAHEMGHALSYAFSQNKLSESSYKDFLKDRKCMTDLTGQSTFQKPLPFFQHPGDTFRTEEDTADLMAFRYGQGMNEIMSCALMEPKYDNSSYEDPTFANHIEFDTHSSPLTRAVREAVHKGIALPVACTKLIGSESLQRFNSCL